MTSRESGSTGSKSGDPSSDGGADGLGGCFERALLLLVLADGMRRLSSWGISMLEVVKTSLELEGMAAEALA